jgi:sortase (surface protein transpeptidase)
MKRVTPLSGIARIIGLLIAIALLLSLFLPLLRAAAQQGNDTTEALAEVPSTGASRPGPVVVSSASVSTPQPPPRREGVAPVEFQVDKIGVDAPIETGEVVDGAMQDPTGPWVVAWYEQIGKIGEGGNIVMAGHVDYWNTGPNGTAGPAVFWDIPHLNQGDIIRLVGEDGKPYEYAVDWVQQFDVATQLTPEVIQKDIIADTPGMETLTLITCGGDFDPATGEYNHRWVLRADQVQQS